MARADKGRLDPAALAALIRPDEAPIPVSVLTGFLGAGKTTVLRHLLTRPGMAGTAIVVNEFGEIGLDHHLLESASEDTLVLANGCLCCAHQGDLVRALRGLLDRATSGVIPTFDRLAIETSGLADPGPVLQSLLSDPLRLSRFRFRRLVGVVDGVLGSATLSSHLEARKQVALADRLLISKADLTDRATLEALRAQMRAINPWAEAAEIRHGILPPAALFEETQDLSAELDWARSASKSAQHGDRFTSLVMTREPALGWPSFSSGLEALITAHGEDLLRIKGLVRAEGEDGPIVLHGVQHVFHAPARLTGWPPGPRRTRLIAITREPARAAIASALERLGLEGA